LATWATGLAPSEDDLALADRALIDTAAATVAGAGHRVSRLAAGMSQAGRWAVAGHVLDYDDLHMESTTHISAVCVPAALASGGDARAYLAGAGVMARLGTALGWTHYEAGWHATCTAGAPAAAAVASAAMGLDVWQTAAAIALAVPGAGGVQRAFGSDGKSLQVGFAVETGLRAAALARAGAHPDLRAVDAWMELLSPRHAPVDLEGPAVPGGLAIKMYPACYALQRPMSALGELREQGLVAEDVSRIVVRTPAATVVPLNQHRPRTGLEGKFSLEYAAAAALLDAHPGFASFTDEAVMRPGAQRLVECVEPEPVPGGDWLLAGAFDAEVHTVHGSVIHVSQQYPPGSPQRPPTPDELNHKTADCLGAEASSTAPTWATAADLLRARFGGGSES